MKTFFLTVVTLFLIHSCNQKSSGNKAIIPENISEINAENPSFVIDSVKIDDSIQVSKTLQRHTYNKVLLFPSIQNKYVFVLKVLHITTISSAVIGFFLAELFK